MVVRKLATAVPCAVPCVGMRRPPLVHTLSYREVWLIPVFLLALTTAGAAEEPAGLPDFSRAG